MVVLGNTYRFKLTATKDEVTWDLTGAAVLLFLRSPAGVVTQKAGSVLVAGDGTAYYDSEVSDLQAAGVWSRAWEVTQGAVVQESAPISFYVSPQQG